MKQPVLPTPAEQRTTSGPASGGLDDFIRLRNMMNGVGPYARNLTQCQIVDPALRCTH
ncbi:hypothetical protein GZH46_01734 [Fragariocoptes setiger]|uniref:Uncharacterized protein n=1 Tax=Fragariocoptes setiger TaxID=1670756 RepID=A0ABQ7S8N8_9ACAR|nr:hypothetical protein GZH46_01734 [Fragariocoptes setiger]